jgi:hypothetical protein
MSKENLGELRKDIKHYDQGVQYAYGPLNKSKETRLYEQIIGDIISDKKNALKEDPKVFEPKIKTRVENKNMYVTRNGEEININKLLKNVNLGHVQLPEKSLRDYEFLYENDKDLRSTVPSRNKFEQKISKADIHQQSTLKQLSYAEKIGINIYTGGDYTEMNGILRGSESPQNFDKHLMNIAVASQGLNSLPSIDLPIVSRREGQYGLAKMLEMQKNHEVEQVKGFLSTATETQTGFGEVQIIYKNVQGVNIAAISTFPKEKEYLVPPSTQIKYTGHKIVDGVNIFTAEGANVLLDKKRTLSPTERVEKVTDNLIKKSEQKIESKGTISNKEAQNFVKKLIDVNVKHGVINEDAKSLYFKKNKFGKSNFEKDIDALKSKPKELSFGDKLLSAASSVSKSLGLKKLSDIFTDKISPQGKTLISEQYKKNLQLVKNIREKLNRFRSDKTHDARVTANNAKSKNQSRGIS